MTTIDQLDANYTVIVISAVDKLAVPKHKLTKPILGNNAKRKLMHHLPRGQVMQRLKALNIDSHNAKVATRLRGRK